MLLERLQQEVEQRRSGLVPDAAFQVGEGRLVAFDQLGDEGRVCREGGEGRIGRPGCGLRVRDRRDEVAAVEDGLQRVLHERIGSAGAVEELGPAGGRGEGLGDIRQPGLIHLRQNHEANSPDFRETLRCRREDGETVPGDGSAYVGGPRV
ncbi:hypothetical protein [Streptomyces sp. NPDC088766]|uniref:hypothetical protein n=1 Tax=Streptomyces sp. NPDC088766 TaxID=3365893 RepID=UPI003823082B